LAEPLEAAGSDVRHKTFHGSTHEFFGMALVVPDAAAAQNLVAHDLKKAFGTAILPIQALQAPSPSRGGQDGVSRRRVGEFANFPTRLAFREPPSP